MRRSREFHPRAPLVVAGQMLTIALLLVAAALVAGMAKAATSTIGRTWPIAEPDALAEIEAKAATLPSMVENFGPRSKWSAMRAASLGKSIRTARRSVVPFYTLATEIRLPDGKLLYPAGFTFNPLTYVSLPQRLVIAHAHDLDWALRTAAPTDWILLAANGQPSADPIALGEKVGRPLYILEERVKERLGLTVAPVIVRQVGQKLELTEIRLDRRSGSGLR